MSYSLPVEHIQDGLRALQARAGHPFLLIASSASSPRSHDLDAAGAQVALEMVRRMPRGELGLVLLCRGGHALFADTLRRALSCHEVKTALLLGRVDGAGAVLSMLAKHLVLAPGSGLGSPASGPVGALAGAWSPEIMEHVSEDLFALDEVDRRRVLSLARQHHAQLMLQRAMNMALAARAMSGWGEQLEQLAASLSLEELGGQLALGAQELGALGVSARWTSPQEDELVRGVSEEVEDFLGLKTRPPAAYTASGIGSEVEFEMATGEPGALIATAQSAHVLELDTGRPDPDTGVYQGDWLGVE